jgi:aconitate decarboxylase
MLAGLDAERLADAIGIYYGQCSGTMQAHAEGTPQLAMQMGFAARSAVTAVELARRSMPGPRAPISGEFGYFALFEGAADPAPFDELGHCWRITELSCKPFPSGRATHGGIDAVQHLIAEEGVTAERVVGCRFRVPPLTARLIRRPVTGSMTPNYARLCLQYVGAVCLRRSTVVLQDFTAEALTAPQTLALADRLQVVEDDNADPNALIPQRVEVDLTDGRTVSRSVEAVLGGPAHPLAPDAMRGKFEMCWSAAPELPLDQGAALWNAASALETLEDVRVLAALTCPPQTLR